MESSAEKSKNSNSKPKLSPNKGPYKEYAVKSPADAN